MDADLSFVNLGNARTDQQRQTMEEILRQGICPFCPENLPRFHTRPVITRTKYWLLTENQWPYENTRVHLLAIYRTHIESIGEMRSVAGRELIKLVKLVEKKYKVPGGALALGMRFGDTETSGATVRHLHAQILSAAITDRTNPRYQPVRFRAG